MLLMGAALALAAPALAEPIQVGFSGSPYGPYQAGVGGEFTLNDVNGIPSDNWLDLSGYVPNKTSNFGPSGISSFQTFCIEVTEHISGFATTYNAQLNTNAVFGSLGSGDAVSQGTGWLYSQFARGVLAYTYADSGDPAPRKVSADLLQKAFWWLENEPGFSSDPDAVYIASNIYIAAVISHFGGSAAARANGGENYGVYAVNLWSGPINTPTQNRAQDQLYYNGLVTTASVPDGGTALALLGLALCGMVVVSRLFRSV